MPSDASFAGRLRQWRGRRGLSQLALAHAADVSQRHVSFIELGRTAPSRAMVLRLAAALDIPLRQQNALLRAAGFAPAWTESALDAPALAAVQRALDFMLAQQEPYPAFVLDRRWNVLRVNAGAERFVAFLTDSAPAPVDPANPINLADALMSPQALRPLIVNWREMAAYFLRSVQADAAADGSAESEALVARLRAYPDVAGLLAVVPEDSPAPVLPMAIAKGGTRLSLLTTLATLGTPQDVTAQEIRVECFFPADDATAAFFRERAA